jgi:lipopolysaccharide biosynthesis glycosyltransferase
LINLYVGLDRREPVCHHVFCFSVARRTMQQCAFTPVSGDRRDSSTEFGYARFLVPYLAGFKGWALFCDGDMVCKGDINELWMMRDPKYAVMVAKHNYMTGARVKMDGVANRHYERKNWSSVMLFNCDHPSNRRLLPGYINASSGEFLHRFKWLDDEMIGDLPMVWNWLVGEYEPNEDAKLLHFTLGAPCFPGKSTCDHAADWCAEYEAMRMPL